jgi:hypothetical protein
MTRPASSHPPGPTAAIHLARLFGDDAASGLVLGLDTLDDNAIV